MNHIERILSRYPFVVLDGGFATELEKMGFDLSDRLWSARVLADSPDAVRDVHLSYLKAGADCIITSSYQATIPGFISSGYTKGESVKLIKSSMKLAQEALDIYREQFRDSSRPEPFIAASAGCYGAYLADGSEYNGNYRLTINEYKDFHRERIDKLAEAGADFIAFETFPNIDEAVAASELMEEYPGIFYWIVFTASDDRHISHGDLFADCVKTLDGRKNLAGLGINCSKPEFISPLLKEVTFSMNVPLVVYPNSGEHFNIDCSCWTDESSRGDFALLAEEWFSLGARVIGGCCRTGPGDIKKISYYRDSLIKQKESCGG